MLWSWIPYKVKNCVNDVIFVTCVHDVIILSEYSTVVALNLKAPFTER